MPYLGLETIRRGKSSQCVQDIFSLHFPRAGSVLDTTWGKGRFWDWQHNLDVVGCDVDTQSGAKINCDYRSLPFTEKSFDVLVFDPPFIFTPGINRIIGTKRFFTGGEPVGPEQRTWSKQLIAKPTNPADLLAHTQRIIEQAVKISRQGLVIKGQDLIVNKADWWSYNTMKIAEDVGIGLPADLLIQHSPSYRMRDPRWKNQYHFRRSHCLYLIWKW